MNNINELIQSFTVFAIPVLLAITLHEAAHAYTAWKLGDDTAHSLGRVTLDPIKHIDPIGTIAMPLLLYFATGGAVLFGYAKPVPVQTRKLRKPRRDMALVALAGPVSNLLQALVWACAAIFVYQADAAEAGRFLTRLCRAGILSNLAMFAFNLFPLLPLDGGRIVSSILPARHAVTFSRIEPFGFYIVTVLTIVGIIRTWWLIPIMTGTLAVINYLLAPLNLLLG